MNGHEQRQIDELKGEVRDLAKSFGDFVGEARERGAEIVGLINTRVAERMGDHDTLRSEVHALKASSNDNHRVAMNRIDALKANNRWWGAAVITATLTGVGAMVSGWAENFFSK